MSDDNKTRLTDLTEKLTEVVINEADPDNWPGAGKPIKKLSQEERGDRYWSKKNAAGTLTLLVKIHSLIGMHERSQKPGEKTPAEADFELGQQVNRAEQEAQRILDRIMHSKK